MTTGSRTTGLALALALMMGLAQTSLNTQARGQDHDQMEPRTLTVSGQGKLSAAPDVAEISVGVVSEAPMARNALSANNEAMATLQGVLKERGVAAKDIQTTNISVSPRYAQPPRPQPGQLQEEFTQRIIGYQVTNTVQITARDIANLGPLLDAVVTAGANQMYGIGFRIEESQKLLDEARKRAMADARRKAELFAGEAGLVLDRPLRISESSGIDPPRPMVGTRMMMAEASVPVAAGEQELSVSVQVVYELKLPQ
ncbi:SIMPL domain-containing protein [soil metagenome]